MLYRGRCRCVLVTLISTFSAQFELFAWHLTAVMSFYMRCSNDNVGLEWSNRWSHVCIFTYMGSSELVIFKSARRNSVTVMQLIRYNVFLTLFLSCKCAEGTPGEKGNSNLRLCLNRNFTPSTSLKEPQQISARNVVSSTPATHDTPQDIKKEIVERQGNAERVNQFDIMHMGSILSR